MQNRTTSGRDCCGEVVSHAFVVGAAIIGPTVKGPVNVPTIVRSYSDYQNKFGTTFVSGSDVYTYFTSIAANVRAL